MNGPSIDEPTQYPTQRERVKRPDGDSWQDVEDTVAREEPFEILLQVGSEKPRRLGLLLRTPGHDRDLALGLLFAEGIIDAASDVLEASFEPSRGEHQEFNSVLLKLRKRTLDWDRIARPLVMTAACGVCGRAMLGGLHEHAKRAGGGFTIARKNLLALPETLRASQAVFSRTGGLHAAALADANGKVQLVREDVGRHNAVDKVVGESLRKGRVPLRQSMLLVSGRAGYEIVQKAVRAGIPAVAAVGAPSSLAIETAKEFGLTLVGFLREGRFNVYCGAERIV